MFLIAKDFGAKPAYLLTIFHPNRVLGVATVGSPFIPPAPPQFHKHFPEGFYMLRFQVLGSFLLLKCDFWVTEAKSRHARNLILCRNLDEQKLILVALMLKLFLEISTFYSPDPKYLLQLKTRR